MVIMEIVKEYISDESDNVRKYKEKRIILAKTHLNEIVKIKPYY